jgi:hypothetical protein
MDEFRAAFAKRGPGGVPLAVYAIAIGAAAVFIMRRKAKGSTTSQGTGTTVGAGSNGPVVPVILGTISVVQSTASAHKPVAKKPPAKGKLPAKKKKATPAPKHRGKGAPAMPSLPSKIHRSPVHNIRRTPAPAGSMPSTPTARHAPGAARVVTATHTARGGQTGTGSSLRLAVNT